MGKKVFEGPGWVFEPAGPDPEPETESLPPEEQTPRVAIEKRSKGKKVTVIRDLTLSPPDLKALAARLKKAVGGGGAVKAGEVEIQGEHVEKVKAELRALGYRVR